jgi:hypothetical protein
VKDADGIEGEYRAEDWFRARASCSCCERGLLVVLLV